MTEAKQYKKINNREKPADPWMFQGKKQPQSIQLEESVLGAILLEKSAFDVVSSLLAPESFYKENHQVIFKAIRLLAAANLPIDLVTVVEQLLKIGELDAAGGPYAVSKLTNSVVSSANIETHAKIIVQKYIAREMGKMAIDIFNDAYDDSIDIFDLIDSVDARFTKLRSGTSQKVFTQINTGIVKSIRRIEELRIIDSHITGVPAGFNELDNLTHGWQDTDLIILAARPSVGKTALAGNIARNAADFFYKDFLSKRSNDPLLKAKSVFFCSLEMSTGQLINRMLSCESEIPLDNISNGKLDDSQMAKLYQKAVTHLSELPIFIDDTAALNIYELKSKCRQLKVKHNLGLIIIDYLQLMSGTSDKNGNREQEVSKISRDLKALAKELSVPVIALSQLSREVEKRKDGAKMPQLSDLRESGSIEQDSDMVMFLYRPEYYDITSDQMGESNKGETHVKIAKHRNGSLGNVKLKANLAIQKFTDWDGWQEVKEKIGSGSWAPIKNHFEPTTDDTPF